MCNSLHTDSKPIPKKGYGWKVFEQHNGRLRAWLKMVWYPRNKWITWDDSRQKGDGFCFFRKRIDANRFAYPKDVIKQIQYRGGVGKQSWRLGTKPLTMALCKEFRILPDKEAKPCKHKKTPARKLR